MRAFFAIALNMGLIDIPTREGYWSTSWESTIPFFMKVMARDRLLQIFWMLHVGDGPRKVDKVKPLCDTLLGNFQANYYPSQNVAVNEAMVGFRGRFGPKQYMPSKPTKYAIKAFTLASSEHRYMLNILLYTGADTLTCSDPAYSLLAHHHALDVPLPQQGTSLCYYSSIPLANVL